MIEDGIDWSSLVPWDFSAEDVGCEEIGLRDDGYGSRWVSMTGQHECGRQVTGYFPLITLKRQPSRENAVALLRAKWEATRMSPPDKIR